VVVEERPDLAEAATVAAATVDLAATAADLAAMDSVRRSVR